MLPTEPASYQISPSRGHNLGTWCSLQRRGMRLSMVLTTGGQSGPCRMVVKVEGAPRSKLAHLAPLLFMF
jgi:hypothetical protein